MPQLSFSMHEILIYQRILDLNECFNLLLGALVFSSQ